MIAVMCLLATRCDPRGETLMNLSSMSAIMRRDGRRMSEDTIRRAIRDLERYGYAEREARARSYGAQTGNLYRLRPFLDAAQDHFQNTPEVPPRPLHAATPTKPLHAATPSSRSSLSKRAASSTVITMTIRTPAPSVAAAITFTAPAKAPPANTPKPSRVAALRSVEMTDPETMALRWDAIPNTVFMAKVAESQSKANPKGNPAGYLRRALDGVLNDPTPTIQPARERAPQATLDARNAAGRLFGTAVNHQPMSRAGAIEAMRVQDDEWQVSATLSDEARSLLRDAVDALLTERGYVA